MNRRTTLATLFGRSSAATTTTVAAPPVVNTGLDPYAGSWEFEQAAHLLRRATFGPTYAQIKTAVQDGLEATIAQLFTDLPLPNPPLNHISDEDANVAIGETWVNAPYSPDADLRAYRNNSLRSWTMALMLDEGVSLRESMVLFWHNHFATSMVTVNDPKYAYKYITNFRENPWGNFRELTKQITVDPMMLRYLNGNQNTEQAPNENYARELLELFTIGKGPLVGDGDHTNYTEDDIVQMARILTGWRDAGFVTQNPDLEIQSAFIPFRHDNGTKQLSHRFDDLVIEDMGENEANHLIDVIFAKEEVARFICRKLYRWFIYYEISDAAEMDVIEPMAQLLIDNDYEIKFALEALLKSQHFYDMLNVGPMIKNPVDFILSAVKSLEIELPNPSNFIVSYRVAFQFFRRLEPLQMNIFAPPSVAGWPAFYQEPTFYRLWINSVTLPLRMESTTVLTINGFNANGFQVRFRPLEMVANFDDPFDPNNLINEFSKILFPQPITQNQIDFLKEILIPGLPDFEWTVEYGDYVNNPTDPDLAAAVENKLKNLVSSMLTMPEFYLS